MNNTFDIKRFGQVLAKDWKDYFRNFGISLIVWCCIPVLFWIATLVFDIDMNADSRNPLLFGLILAALMFVPSKVYGKANLTRDGVNFATLPATNSEKFFSMLIYCSILSPLIVGLGSWGVDSLLTLLPFGGFKEYVLPITNKGLEIIATLCSILMVSSIFMFGNMLFKKRKPGKTIAWAMLIAFVITMVVQVFGGWAAFIRWEIGVKPGVLPWIYIAFLLVIAIVFYYLTYRRIKNQKY